MLLFYLMLSSKNNSYAISLLKPGLREGGELGKIRPLPILSKIVKNISILLVWNFVNFDTT